MSGAATGAAETAKLPEKKTEGEPQNEPQNQIPAFLEEDDEFEDFPVEGELKSLLARNFVSKNGLTIVQTGQRRKRLHRREILTYGRRVGMTMTRTKSSLSSLSAFYNLPIVRDRLTR